MDIQSLIKLFPFLAILAPIFLFWGAIKETIHRIFNLFIIQMDMKDEAARAMAMYLKNNTKKIPAGFFAYRGLIFFLKKEKRNGAVVFKNLSEQNNLLFLNKKPIIVLSNGGNDKKTNEYFQERINMFFVRGFFKPDELMKEATEQYNQYLKVASKRFYIQIITGSGSKTILSEDRDNIPFSRETSLNDILHTELVSSKFEDIGYNTSKENVPFVFYKQAQEIYLETKRWLESQDWYFNKGILWRRGVLLHGIPGSGKTSLIRTIGQKLDLPIFVFDLASLTNSEFVKEWQNLQRFTPCIAIFEDIDAVFSGRNNIVENGGGLSFDCLLNAVGGALPSEGVFTFVTTNHVERVDEALGVSDLNGVSSRPGRLDKIYKMDYATKECKVKIAEKILGSNFDKNLIDDEEVTIAQFVEKCASIALEEFWNKKE